MERRCLTADAALRPARCLGTTPRFWLNLQARYDLDVEADRLGDRLDREVTAHRHDTMAAAMHWRRIIAFRDHLRRHPDAAAYAQLKRELAERFSDDRRNYTVGKHAFVVAIEQRAGISHGPCDICDGVEARPAPSRPPAGR